MLSRAVSENLIDVVRFLLANGERVPEGAHPLHAAVANDNREMAELLLPVCPVGDRDESGRTPLHCVRSPAMAELLLDHGADLGARDADGKRPHETVTVPAAREVLERRFRELFPEPERNRLTLFGDRTEPEDWERRFSVERVTMRDLIPIDDGADPEQAHIRYGDREYRLSRRFFSSFARRMKFSSNVFNYFSPQEFLTRVAERNPEVAFQATFDNASDELLGVIDPDRKLLPAHLACKVIADDPRTEKISYRDGVWEAEMSLDETFHVPQAGDYIRKLQLHYPVDGVGMPCIYLATMRQVCSNGAVAAVSQFRTDIEVNDESGTHLGKLLKSFSNDYGFSAMSERLIAAQDTVASVNEFLTIDALIAANVSDKNAYRVIHDRLNDVAGDPCYQYAVTSLQSIPRKKQSLMPVVCSVNDLLNFCSELTTHHGELLHRPRAFDEKAGQMLSQEFDLEGIYHTNGRPSPDFFLDDLELGGHRAAESRQRRKDLVYQND